MENGTWELVSRPENKSVLKNKWVFRLKKRQDGSIEKFKARLVARGDQQKKGIDYEEVFAPVARYDTIRAFLATCVEMDMHVHQMDVVTAYVQGDLNEDIYMIQPEMFISEGNENKVCKLNRPLYGLKQAGREWYQKLDTSLASIKFEKSPENPCVYSRTCSDAIIVVYVDDLLIGSKSMNEIIKVKNLLKKKFKMTDLGEAKDILGMNIHRNKSENSITLSQRSYTETLLEKFGMANCKSVSTPLEPNIKLIKVTEPQSRDELSQMKDRPYRELIGNLIYLANATRPDIAFAVSSLSSFCDNPNISHWKSAKHVLRYLRGTLDYKITYKKINSKLEAYVDSDWAGDINDRRSCTGYVTMLAGGPISWNSRKQRSVALSTMEAEYMALSEVTKEVIYLRKLMKHIKQDKRIGGPTTIYCDNQSAINLSKNNVQHSRSKHIDIRYHFTREAQQNGKIIVTYLETSRMKADMLTKSLPKTKHAENVKLLNMNIVDK